MVAEHSAVDLFWKRVDRSAGDNGCWLYLGPLSNGYGRFSVGGKSRRAHRFSYELVHGSIPTGLQLDHLCRNRACVNPAHLEPVTNRVNVLRGVGFTAANARKTHCPKGHEYTEANTKWGFKKNGSRSRTCRTCLGEWERARHRRLRAEAKAVGHCGRCARPPERCRCGKLGTLHLQEGDHA